MKKKGLKLNQILKNLHINLKEASNVLRSRPDLGDFKGGLSCEINTFQLGELIKYMKNNKIKTPKKYLNNKEQQVKNKKKLSDKQTEINIQQIDNKKFNY